MEGQMTAHELLECVPMTHDDQWPAALTHSLGERVKSYRKARDLSAEQFATELSDAGMPYTRAQVSNLEARRRTSITVGEVLMFARVLDVPPAMLLLPIGSPEDVEILPGVYADPWSAYRWMAGTAPLAERNRDHYTVRISGGIETMDYFADSARPITLYAECDQAMKDFGFWRSIGTESATEKAMNAVRELVNTRRELRKLGLDVPELTGPISEAVAAQEGNDR